MSVYQKNFAVVGAGFALLAAAGGANAAGTPGPASAVWEMGGFIKGVTAYPMGKAVVRSAPSPTAPALRELAFDAAPTESGVTIGERLDATFRDANGYRDSWYKVSFADANGAKQNGFVWGGSLAKAALSADLDGDGKRELVLIGVGGKPGANPADTRRVVTARVINGNGGATSALGFAPVEMREGDSFGYTLSAQAISKDKGLSGRPGLVRVQFRYGACDYPNGDAYLVYSQKQLRYGLTAVSVANEVGSMVSEVIFPSDKNGKKGRVVVRTVTRQGDETTSKIVRTFTDTKTYAWNGVALTPSRR